MYALAHDVTHQYVKAVGRILHESEEIAVDRLRRFGVRRAADVVQARGEGALQKGLLDHPPGFGFALVGLGQGPLGVLERGFFKRQRMQRLLQEHVRTFLDGFQILSCTDVDEHQQDVAGIVFEHRAHVDVEPGMRPGADGVEVFLVALITVVRDAADTDFERGFRRGIGNRAQFTQHLLIMLPHATVWHIEFGLAHQAQPGIVIAKDLPLLVEDHYGRRKRIEQRGLAGVFATCGVDLFCRLLGAESHVKKHQHSDDAQHGQVFQAPQLTRYHQADGEQQRENSEQMTQRQPRKESQSATLMFRSRMQCLGLS